MTFIFVSLALLDNDLELGNFFFFFFREILPYFKGKLGKVKVKVR